MNLKTYQADSMADALAQVKKDLGNNAVILHTRTVKRGGILGVGGRSVVEITAGNDPAVLPQAKRPAIIADPEEYGSPARCSGDMDGVSHKLSPAEGAAMKRDFSPRTEPDHPKRLSTLHGEITELRAMVRELLDRPVGRSAQPPIPEMPDELREYYTRLIQNSVADDLAGQIIATAADRLRECRSRLHKSQINAQSQDRREKTMMADMVRAVIVETIEKMLPPSQDVPLDTGSETRFIALVGPTGVGKTTTIAKLAAKLKLRQHLRVGLITVDTYRIAAVDQLKTYAEILDIPLEIVLTPEEMQQAVDRLADREVVLIDTSGRSQNDTDRLGELKSFLEVVGNPASGIDYCVSDRVADIDSNPQDRLPASGDRTRLQTHLVLSCTAHPRQLAEVTEKFGVLGIDRVVFTKLDEAVGLGVVLNVISRTKWKLSYLTAGQDVPEDIEVGQVRRIAQMILSEGPDPSGRSQDRTTRSPWASMETIV